MEGISEIQKSINRTFELEEKSVFAVDLSDYIGSKVAIRGVVNDKFKNPKFDFGKVIIADITGEIVLHMNYETFQKNKDCFWKGNCIGCRGIVKRIVKDNLCKLVVTDIENVEVVFSSKYRDDYIITEKESMLFLSRIVNSCCRFLRDNDFQEIETKLISTYSVDDGLSPLKVVYPGFGEPVFLSTSPSPQLLDFLLTSYLDRVFTVSTSFSPTYRFPGMGTAEKIVATKFLKLKTGTINDFLIQLLKFLLSEFKIEKSIDEHSLKWGDTFIPPKESDSYYFLKYETNMPVHRNNIHTSITEIYHIIDSNGTLIIEATSETLLQNEKVQFFTTILYPNQFLSTIHKKPLKPMRNLWRVGNGNR